MKQHFVKRIKTEQYIYNFISGPGGSVYSVVSQKHTHFIILSVFILVKMYF
jgi:hypothetical protein